MIYHFVLPQAKFLYEMINASGLDDVLEASHNNVSR